MNPSKSTGQQHLPEGWITINGTDYIAEKLLEDLHKSEESGLKMALRIVDLEDKLEWKKIAVDGLPGEEMKDDQHVIFTNSRVGFTYEWGMIKNTVNRLIQYVGFTHWREIELPNT